MAVFLVRHGATEWSLSGQHTGVTDLPLLPEGEAQAVAVGPKLAATHFDLVLTSPRQRARRTAELAGYPHAEVDPDLAEWDYGDFEGLTTEQIQADYPGWTIWSGPWVGGESEEQITARLDRVVDRVRDVEGDTLVFAHGHSLRVFAARWLTLPAHDGSHFWLDTATVSVLGSDRGRPVVVRWNG
jgi:broad specificity phosphatase PhoE